MTFRITCAGNREASFARVAWLTPATSPFGGRPAPLRGPPTCRNGNVPCFSRFAPRPRVILIRQILEEEAKDATEKTERQVPIAVPTGAFELGLPTDRPEPCFRSGTGPVRSGPVRLRFRRGPSHQPSP